MYDVKQQIVETSFINGVLTFLVRKGVVSYDEANEAMRVLEQGQHDKDEKAA